MMLLVTSIVMHCENDGEDYNCFFEAFSPTCGIHILPRKLYHKHVVYVSKISASDGRKLFFFSI